MTVFAYKDGIISVDTQISSGDHICGKAQKWRKVPDGLGGGYVLASGVTARCVAVMEAVARNGHQAKIETDDEIIVTWFRADRTIWAVEKEAMFQIEADIMAEGAGRAYAVGAMIAGASAEEAVRIAIQCCTGCGGDVTILSVA